MYDEDTMPVWVKEKIKQPIQSIVNKDGLIMPPFYGIPSDVTAIDTSQPPPHTILPTAMPAFPLGARLLMPNVHLPLGVPPPNMLGVLQSGLMGFPLAATTGVQQQQQASSGDDHMDIEMEDEHNTPSTSKDSHTLLQQQAGKCSCILHINSHIKNIFILFLKPFSINHLLNLAWDHF